MSEYQKLKERGFQNYSLGHRAMYHAPIEMLQNTKTKILDVGFGVGYGLDLMIQKNCFSSYVGFEPDKDSFDYVCNRHGNDPRITLINSGLDVKPIKNNIFDATFCIEVIEHVQYDFARNFIGTVFAHTSNILFLSTPDVNKNSHGKFTHNEICNLIIESGFKSVVKIDFQWTNLYIGEV